MTIEEYKDLLLEDELKSGYEVEDDLPDEYEDDSYIDGLLTDGMSEMFGEEVVGFSLS